MKNSEIEIYNFFNHEGGELEVDFKGNHVRVAFYIHGEEHEIEDCFGDHVDWHHHYCNKKVAKDYAIQQYEDWIEGVIKEREEIKCKYIAHAYFVKITREDINTLEKENYSYEITDEWVKSDIEHDIETCSIRIDQDLLKNCHSNLLADLFGGPKLVSAFDVLSHKIKRISDSERDILRKYGAIHSTKEEFIEFLDELGKR